MATPMCRLGRWAVRATAATLIGAPLWLGSGGAAFAFLFGWEEPRPRVAPQGYYYYPDRYYRHPQGLTPPAQRPRRATPRRARPRPMSEAEKEKYEQLLAKAKQGLLLISISLDRQELTLYVDGVELARSPVSTGTRSHPTPTGIFSVIQKNRHHRSNLYSNAPMPYMQRLTWSGIALHEGVLPGYPASHGCIRLPESFARLLWGATKLGARVVVGREPVIPYEFAHPRLFAPKPTEPAGPQAQVPTPASGVGAGEPVMVATAQPASEAFAAVKLRPALTPFAPIAMVEAPRDVPLPEPPPTAAKPLRPGPVSVFVSRKERKLYVRKGFAPVFDAPVTIERPDEPIGTHLFTAIAANESEATFRWAAISMPSRQAASPSGRPNSARSGARRLASEAGFDAPAPGAQAALERIAIAPETFERIRNLMGVGASFTVSDHGLGPETGLETDFIVVTH